MEQIHGTFVPGANKAIHGRIEDRTAHRIELIVLLANRLENAKDSRNVLELQELAAEWDGLGGSDTAKRIRLLAGAM